MRKNRIGFIGFGGQAVEQAEHVGKTSNGVVVAISDVNKDVQMGMTPEFRDLPFYTDYEKMIENEDLDSVFIAIPHNLHFQATQFAIKHNLDVIKEKPLAMNVEEGNELIQLAKKNNQTLFTLTQRRGHEAFLKGKELIEKIGYVNLIKGEYTFNGGPYDYGWRGIKDIAGGGAAFDMGYHILDVIIWYFGIPKTVHAFLKDDSRKDADYNTEDSAVVTFKTANGALGSLFLSRATQPKNEQLVIYGSEGVLEIKRTKVILRDQKGSVIEEYDFNKDWDHSIQSQLETFFSSEDKQYSDDHLNHLRLLSAIYQSDKENLVVDL